MSRGKAIWFPQDILLKLEAMQVGNETIPSVVERLLVENQRLKEELKRLREGEKEVDDLNKAREENDKK